MEEKQFIVSIIGTLIALVGAIATIVFGVISSRAQQAIKSREGHKPIGKKRAVIFGGIAIIGVAMVVYAVLSSGGGDDGGDNSGDITPPESSQSSLNEQFEPTGVLPFEQTDTKPPKTTKPTYIKTSEPPDAEPSEPTDDKSSEPTDDEPSETTPSSTSTPASSSSTPASTSSTPATTPPPPSSPESDFTIFDNENGTATIRGYTGRDKNVVIPSVIDGKTIVRIDECNNCPTITSMFIPDSVTEVNDFLFVNCVNLSSINVGSQNSAFTSLDGVLFNKAQTELIRYPQNKTTAKEYTVPNGIVSIRTGAFLSVSLTSIEISKSVTSIGTWAFDICSNLSYINVDAQNRAYSSLDGALFDKNKTEIICYPAGKTYTIYVIPDSVIKITSLAFHNCARLNSVIIPDGVKNIEFGAFQGCERLTSATIPRSVTNIGDYAFDACKNITSVTFASPTPPSMGTGVFQGCELLSTIYVPSGSKSSYEVVGELGKFSIVEVG